jgi:hypothetical protein
VAWLGESDLSRRQSAAPDARIRGRLGSGEWSADWELRQSYRGDFGASTSGFMSLDSLNVTS